MSKVLPVPFENESLIEDNQSYDVSYMSGYSGFGTTRPVTPVEESIRRLYDAFYRFPEEKCFWTPKRRSILSVVSQRFFGACFIAGVVFCSLTLLWRVLLGKALNMYNITTVDESSKPPKHVNVFVKSPFIEDIKYLGDAFIFYFMGATCMLVGGMMCVSAAGQPIASRLKIHSTACLFLLLSICFIVLGPYFPLSAHTHPSDKEILNKNHYLASQSSIEGSLQYYYDHQCKDIDAAVTGRSKQNAKEMRAFCDTFYRTIIILFVMWGSALFPFITLGMSGLVVAVNIRHWNVKAGRTYKERSPKQIDSDRCWQD